MPSRSARGISPFPTRAHNRLRCPCPALAAPLNCFTAAGCAAVDSCASQGAGGWACHGWAGGAACAMCVCVCVCVCVCWGIICVRARDAESATKSATKAPTTKAPTRPPTTQTREFQCAIEDHGAGTGYGQQYTCSCTGQVKFGLGSKWSVYKKSAGSIACTNGVFGDPIPGTAKVCMCKPSTSS